ncbi:MAG: HEAT repeat domain-containing protein [Chloroflexi bacterium]|nr:HEAT repeat domain-containing protein [Chloroflexota bacterium]
MSYEIEAVAARESILRKHASAFSNAYVVPLVEGLALIPMIDALYQEINKQALRKDKGGLHGFESLSPALADWIEHISHEGLVAYFEAGYFGGLGSQQALVWSNGRIAAGPLYGNAINQVLHLLGLERSGEDDEFDRAGLGRYRHTDKWAAAVIVDDFQRHTGDSVGGIVKALRFSHSSKFFQDLVRETAAERLKLMGPAAKEALPALFQSAIEDEAYGVRLGATTALAAIGPEAVPLLIALLTHTDVQDRWPAAFALGKLGSLASEAVPALTQALNDPDSRVRRQVAETLGEIGPAAHEAVAALSDVLNDPEWLVRSAVARALGKIRQD